MPVSKLWAYRHAIICSYEGEAYYKTNDEERVELLGIKVENSL